MEIEQYQARNSKNQHLIDSKLAVIRRYAKEVEAITKATYAVHEKVIYNGKIYFIWEVRTTTIGDGSQSVCYRLTEPKANGDLPARSINAKTVYHEGFLNYADTSDRR